MLNAILDESFEHGHAQIEVKREIVDGGIWP